MRALAFVLFLACSGHVAAQSNALKKALLKKSARPEREAPVEEPVIAQPAAETAQSVGQGNDALLSLLKDAGSATKSAPAAATRGARTQQVEQPSSAKRAAQEPLSGLTDLMQDPATMAKMQKMMSDPKIRSQAQQAMKALQGGGSDLPGLLKNLGAGMPGGNMQETIQKAINHPDTSDHIKKIMSDPRFEEHMNKAAEHFKAGSDYKTYSPKAGRVAAAPEAKDSRLHPRVVGDALERAKSTARRKPVEAEEDGDDLLSVLKNLGAGSKPQAASTNRRASEVEFERPSPASRKPAKPDALEEMMQHVSRPENQAQINKMLSDPSIREQAKKMMAQMQGSAELPNMLKNLGAARSGGSDLPSLLKNLGVQSEDAEEEEEEEPEEKEDHGGLLNTLMNLGGGRKSAADLPTHKPHDWELANLHRHKKGELNSAELGMAHLKHAMKNPGVMQEWMQALNHPQNHAALKKMIHDPSFQKQAQEAMQQMQETGDLPEFWKHLQQAKGASAAPQARDWERRHAQHHREGRMNQAELGMSNLKHAMKDPSVQAELQRMMKDPKAMADIKRMMADPNFMQQARQMAAQMKDFEL